MIDSHYREYFQTRFIEPGADYLDKFGLSPNQTTLLACGLGVLYIPFMAMGWPLIALLFLLASGYLDALDGTLARKQGVASDKGAMLDIVCDRVVELSAVLGLYLYAPGERGFACLLLLGSFYLCVTTFLVTGIFEKNDSEKSFHYSPGLIERSETFIFFVVVTLFAFSFLTLATLFSALVFYTAYKRLREGAGV